MADTIGGMTAAFAVAAALARGADGAREASLIDVSMLEATMATMGWVVSNYLVAGREPAPMGNENFTASPSGTFRTAAGLLNIAANKQEQFEAVCRVIGRPDLVTDPRFAERQGRLDHRAALKAELEAALAARPAPDWERDLNAAGVPAGRVLSVPEANMLGATDEEHLALARAEGRVLFTHDDDFLRLAAAGAPHAGMVYAPRQTSRRHRPRRRPSSTRPRTRHWK